MLNYHQSSVRFELFDHENPVVFLVLRMDPTLVPFFSKLFFKGEGKEAQLQQQQPCLSLEHGDFDLRSNSILPYNVKVQLLCGGKRKTEHKSRRKAQKW